MSKIAKIKFRKNQDKIKQDNIYIFGGFLKTLYRMY